MTEQEHMTDVIVNAETPLEFKILNLKSPLKIWCVNCGQTFTTDDKRRSLVAYCNCCIHRSDSLTNKYKDSLSLNYKEIGE
jgi:hypothetical protein